MSEAASNYIEFPEKEVLRAIFQIETDDGVPLGTGFLVLDQRHVLTARHVAEISGKKNEKLAVIIDSQKYMAKVKKSLKQWDVALLELDTPVRNIEPFTLLSQVIDPETQFRSYGFPEEFDPGWFEGKVTGQLLDGTYQITFDRIFQNQLKGLSGGPVILDKTYSVVAMVIEHDLDDLSRGKIIPIEAFYNLLFSDSQEPWCYVILSEADKIEAECNRDTLHGAVKRAVNLLSRDPQVEKDVRPPDFTYATILVTNPASYEEAVKKICRAKIAIFDVTNYEPAVMLLLGIRSVVRRGVTIVSCGGEYVIGNAINPPFNIKEVNIISHSAKQAAEGDKGHLDETPPYIIRDRIRDGLLHLNNLPQYLDLPTFDAIRNLPQGYRKLDTDNVLVLCPYSETYENTNWKRLWRGLKEQLDSKTGGRSSARIVRVRDLMSPRLVSHTIYEAIRRTVLCIVDWTQWRPNVFFELGVRLAVTNETGYTICIIEDKQVEQVNKIYNDITGLRDDQSQSNDSISASSKVNFNDSEFASSKGFEIRMASQYTYLLNLFQPFEYTLSHPIDDLSQYEAMMHFYRGEGRAKIAANGRVGRMPEDTYKIIEGNINTGEEITATPVYLELLRTADLFDVEESKGQATVLYPNNETLRADVESGIMERLLAAWYFIYHEYKPDDIVKNPQLFNACQDIGPRLSRWLEENRRSDLAIKIYRFTERLRRLRKREKDNYHE